MILFIIIYIIIYIIQSADQIDNYIYKLVYKVYENKYKCWEFIYIDYSKLDIVILLNHINIEKYKSKQALI